MNHFGSSGFPSKDSLSDSGTTLNTGKASVFIDFLHLLFCQFQFFHILSNLHRVGRMDQAMHRIAYDKQILIRICSAVFPRRFVMTMDCTDFQFFTGHSTSAHLCAVQRNPIIIVQHGFIHNRVTHQVMQDAENAVERRGLPHGIRSDPSAYPRTCRKNMEHWLYPVHRRL